MTPHHDYLTKAGELMAKAEAEHAMIMRAMYESLARSYLRLAERERASAAPVPPPGDSTAGVDAA